MTKFTTPMEYLRKSPYVDKFGNVEDVEAYVEALEYYLAMEKLGKVEDIFDASEIRINKLFLEKRATRDGFIWKDIVKEATIKVNLALAKYKIANAIYI